MAKANNKNEETKTGTTSATTTTAPVETPAAPAANETPAAPAAETVAPAPAPAPVAPAVATVATAPAVVVPQEKRVKVVGIMDHKCNIGGEPIQIIKGKEALLYECAANTLQEAGKVYRR